MTHGTAARTDLQARPIAAGRFTWPAAEPQLGSRCSDCGATTFPAQSYCPRCAGDHQVPSEPKVAPTHVYGAPGVSACTVLSP